MERLVFWHRTLPPLIEEAEYAASATQWVRYVVRTIEEIGGEVLSAFAGTVVASFEIPSLVEAVHAAYRLTAHAEQVRVPEGGMRVAIGISWGK